MNDLFSPPPRRNNQPQSDDWLDRSLSFGSGRKTSEHASQNQSSGREIEYLFFVLASFLLAPFACLSWLSGYFLYWSYQEKYELRYLRTAIMFISSTVVLASCFGLLYYCVDPILKENFYELQALKIWKLKLGEKLLGSQPYDSSFWFSFTPRWLFDWWHEYHLTFIPFLQLSFFSTLIFGSFGAVFLKYFAAQHNSRFRPLILKPLYQFVTGVFNRLSQLLMFTTLLPNNSTFLSTAVSSFNLYSVALGARWVYSVSTSLPFVQETILQCVLVLLSLQCFYLYIAHVIAAFKNRDLSLQPSKKSIYFGQDATGNRIVVPLDTLYRHCEVVGPTGLGKTTLLRNIYFHHISKGLGFIHIDLKAKQSDIFELIELAKSQNRLQDVVLINLADPSNSCSYNPLAKGDYGELKDKFMGAFDWSEEYYKKVAESFLQTVLKALVYVRDQKSKVVTIQDLYRCSQSTIALELLSQEVSDNPSLRQELQELIDDLNDKRNARDLRSLRTNLKVLATSAYGSILTDTRRGLNLLDAILEKKIVLIYLDSQKYMEDAIHLGRLFLSELRVASGTIAEEGLDAAFPGCTVIIDEAADFVTSTFIGFLNRARSSKLRIVLSHQSPYDFDPKLTKQIEGNTQIAFYFRHDDKDASDQIASSIGTHTRQEFTYQTETRPYKRSTGLGSRRQVEAFNVHPNEIKKLKTGDSVYLSRGEEFAVIKVNSIQFPTSNSLAWRVNLGPFPLPERCLDLYSAEPLEKARRDKKKGTPSAKSKEPDRNTYNQDT